MFFYNPGTCGACGEFIPPGVDSLKAFQMQWHLDHLLCNICHKDFSEDPSSVCEGVDGFAYCPGCWQIRFCPSCGTCGKPVVGQTMNALNKSYHPEGCFVCFECKGPLDGKFYASKKGDLLCEHHYFAENGRICGGCGKAIIAGKVVTTKAEGNFPEVRFHRDHFKCAYCNKEMAGERYKRKGDKFYCPTCHLQLFE